MNVIGSPEWFHEKAQSQQMLRYREKMETLRAAFLEKFAPEKLAEMSAEELLRKVFGNSYTSMLQLLMFDSKDYWEFGSVGHYKYNFIVYQTDNGTWKYKEGHNAEIISEDKAKQKAVYIRDRLLEAVQIISQSKLNTIGDYEKVSKKLSHIFFFQYAWAMKYYQMLFPYYFPGMYADGKKEGGGLATLDRAIDILGLKCPSGSGKRFVKAGEVSLFIRRCDINNIVFNYLYAEEWSWEIPYTVCPNAAANYAGRNTVLGEPNLSYYRIPSAASAHKKDFSKQAETIEKSLDELHLKGEDREAVVRVRINQGEFRDRLLKRYAKCCLCGVSDARFLVASHIKPWAACEPEEKLDPDNGFLLCPNHDRLFDQGFITFEEDGTIRISTELTGVDRIFMNIREDTKIELHGQNGKYLAYHRDHVFKK